MTTKEALVRARALIEDPANWKQGGLATPDLEKAEAVGPFCAIGAIGKVNEVWGIGGWGGRDGSGMGASVGERNWQNPEATATFRAAKGLLEECLPAPVHEYNDTHDHACVLAAFDAAIARV